MYIKESPNINPYETSQEKCPIFPHVPLKQHANSLEGRPLDTSCPPGTARPSLGSKATEHSKESPPLEQCPCTPAILASDERRCGDGSRNESSLTSPVVPGSFAVPELDLFGTAGPVEGQKGMTGNRQAPRLFGRVL